MTRVSQQRNPDRKPGYITRELIDKLSQGQSGQAVYDLCLAVTEGLSTFAQLKRFKIVWENKSPKSELQTSVLQSAAVVSLKKLSMCASNDERREIRRCYRLLKLIIERIQSQGPV